jgi:prevent-host-death family protein
MKHVGIFEAKTHLSSLLDEVEKGGEITITRHGKPVAKLIQATATLTKEEVVARKQALRELRAMAREAKLNPTIEEIKDWINEGRRC